MPQSLLLFLFLSLLPVEGTINNLSSSSLSLSSFLNEKWGPRPRPSGCRYRPWICRRLPYRRRLRCCRNLCVDVRSDVNNCGLCGIRCPFAWKCCRGFCSNVNFSRFNCGKCGNRCPFGIPCLYGMCGYVQPFPPLPPPRPRPPHPFPPPRPRPPRPFPPPQPRPPHPFPPPRSRPPKPEPPEPQQRQPKPHPWPPKPEPPKKPHPEHLPLEDQLSEFDEVEL